VAQERNEINSAETAEIKNEIERTRVEMSETLGEIQERLRPDHLIQQAKDTVADAATGKVRNIMNSAGETATMMADQTKYAGRSVADYVRMHPVQIAVIAGGITWWLLRNRGMSDDYEGASEGWQDGQGYDEGYSYNENRPLTAKVGDYASSARETAGEYASSARDTVGEYATSAASSARRAGQRVRSAASTAAVTTRQTLQRTTTSVNDWTTEYPLAAGAIAVAIGAAVGLSAPGTEVENRYMGEKRDQAMERARAAAEELRQNVTQKAKNVAETVVDTANAISSAVTTPASQTSTSSSPGSV
jgi:gas vesicle protein